MSIAGEGLTSSSFLPLAVLRNIQIHRRNPPYRMPDGSSRKPAGSVPAFTAVASLFGRPRETGGLIGSLGVKAEPSLYPEARFILYQVLVRNASSQPLMNARVVPEVVNGSVRVKDAPKIIPKLGPNSSGTATFTLDPTGEVDVVEIEGFMTFSRERHSARLQLALPRVSFNFSMPPLVRSKVSHEQWKEKVSKYFSDEEAFVSRRNGEDTLRAATKVLQDIGLVYITRFKAEEGFAAERRDFFGADKRGRGYAARILWRYPPSKGTHPTLLARIFCETEEGLFAFCHRAFRRMGRELLATRTEAPVAPPGSDQPPF